MGKSEEKLEDKKFTQYRSGGEIMRNGDFESLFEMLEYREGTGEIAELAKIENGEGSSELDKILFHMARFAKKPKFKDENESNEEKESIRGEIVELPTKFMDCVFKLLKNGANPNAVVVNGITPLMAACTVNNREFAKALIENQYEYEDLETGESIRQCGNPNESDGRGQRPLLYAVMTGALDVMDYLVKELNDDIDRGYFFLKGKTVLHKICEEYSSEISFESDGLEFSLGNEDKDYILDKLFELGANPTLADDNDFLPEELIPVFESDLHEGDYSKEDAERWDAAFKKVADYRREFVTARSALGKSKKM